MIYTVTLNPALDYILRLPRLSSEDVNRADSAQLLCGGKGINVSMVLSGLEVPTRALGFVAGFTGRALEQMLQAQGIQTDFVPLAAGNTRINVKIFAIGKRILTPQVPSRQRRKWRLCSTSWRD